MIRIKHSQAGMSTFGFGLMLILLTFLTAVTMKMVPVYIEHYYVVHSLEALQNSAEQIRDDEIKANLLKNFTINDVDNVDRQQIKIKHQSNNTRKVSIEYEVRRSIMGNVDVVISFSDHIELEN